MLASQKIMRMLCRLPIVRAMFDWQSRRFWGRNDTGRLAKPGYYARRDELALEWLREIAPFNTAFEFGCGDGSFAAVMAPMCGQVVGYDRSPSLASARNHVSEQSQHVRFVEDSNSPSVYGPFDIFVAFGVLTCLFTQRSYDSVLQLFADRVSHGGYLLVTATVGTPCEIIKVRRRDGYVACYRADGDDIQRIESAGFILVRQQSVLDWSEDLSNRLMLFRRNIAT